MKRFGIWASFIHSGDRIDQKHGRALQENRIAHETAAGRGKQRNHEHAGEIEVLADADSRAARGPGERRRVVKEQRYSKSLVRHSRLSSWPRPALPSGGVFRQ
jgi:hypothetical protein